MIDANFWIERWQSNNIGFHLNVPNPRLTENFAKLGLAPGARVFVPLCGKTLDMPWLLSQGFRVVGAELSELAVSQFFEEMKLTPEIQALGPLKRYRVPNLDIFAGDIFELQRETLGPVDAVYDRAALVALPEELRRRYATHLDSLTGAAPQLLVTFEYNQENFAGPPFSVSPEFIRSAYGARHSIREVWRGNLSGGLKNGEVQAQEAVWLLANS